MNKRTLLGLVTGVSALFCSNAAQAQWTLGQTFLVGFNFCPRWSTEARGQLLPISQNEALYSLMGTTYGGDGRTTFALPDLRSRFAVGWNPSSPQAPGLPVMPWGQMSGHETTTLISTQMPTHTHTGYAVGSNATANTGDPTNAVPGPTPVNVYNAGTPNTPMKPGTAVLNPTGGNQPFENMNPYLGLRYCVVLEGIYPSRN